MSRNTSDKIMKNFNELGIFTKKEYTFVEFVKQLKMFETEAAKLIVGEEAGFVKMDEVICKCESLARTKNLQRDKRVTEGIIALKQVQKQLSIALSGKHGEDRVANTFQYITRPDATFYRNIYISDEQDETELDAVVLTRNGFIILEVKNAKEDITIASDGRILFNNSSCYHDISVGDKMDKKRRLLKQKIKDEFVQKGIEKDILIDSLIVFSTPNGKKVNVKDLFKQEKYCLRGSLYKRIDNFESNIEYTSDELEIINGFLQQLETEKKPFEAVIDLEVIKKQFADAVEVLACTSKPKKIKALFERIIIRVSEIIERNCNCYKWENTKKYSTYEYSK